MSATSRNAKPSIVRIKNRVLEKIWEAEPSELTRVKRVLNALLRIILIVGRGFIEHLVKLQAMALAFKTLLSLAPFLAVVFSILKAFGVHNRLEPALSEAMAPLGDKGEEITSRLIGFVDNMSAGALGTVGFVTLFVTVISLLGNIEQSFNYIWRVKIPRRVTRKFSDYLSVLLVGPILVLSALTVTATLQSNAFVQKLISIEPFGTLMLVLLRLVPYLTIWGAFSFLYVFIPNTRVKIRSAVIGGLVAALLWETVGWGFAVFVASSTRYYTIYSSFAILLLFLLWLYIGWVIVLLGAEVAYAHQHLHLYEGEREILAESPVGRERLALQMMFLLGRQFYDGLPALNLEEFATRLRVPVDLVKEFLQRFQQRQLVVALEDQSGFVPARDPEQISIKEILDCVRTSEEDKRDQGEIAGEGGSVDFVLRELDRSTAVALAGKNLKTLVRGQNPPRS